MDDFLKNKPDVDLAEACASGDRDAQRTLFERVKNPMFGVCLRYSDNRAAAEDLLQEGFIRVFRDIGRYRGEGSLDGWVRRVFVRTAIGQFQKQKNLPQTTDLSHLENWPAEPNENFDPDDPESAIKLLQKLPPGFRNVLNLYVLEEKSHEEIARELGIAVSTSRSQLARAKGFLKKMIQKTFVLI